MSYSLFLDDVRDPKTDKDWVVARSFQEFVDIIERLGEPKHISFDHDLGQDEDGNMRKSGMSCVKWLIDNNICPETFNVHSANPVGKENIKSLMSQYMRYKSSEE